MTVFSPKSSYFMRFNFSDDKKTTTLYNAFTQVKLFIKFITSRGSWAECVSTDLLDESLKGMLHCSYELSGACQRKARV